MKRSLSRAALGAALLAVQSVGLTACNFAPTYRTPEAPAPAAFKEAGTDWQTAQPADAAPRGAWWQAFGDPQLDQLEHRLVDANQDLRAAVARYEQARAQVRVDRADLWPTLDIGAGLTRQRQSGNSPRHSPNLPTVYNDYSLSADFSYELDLWGRVRNTLSAAKAQAQASAGDLAALNLSLQAELASNYFSLRAADTEQQLLDDTVAAYQKALELTRNRYQGGAAAAADVDQAQTQLETARAQAADVRLQRARLEHAIAVLVGVPPSALSLATAPLELQPPPITPRLPSQLLQRRPDIAAAERRVLAANAQIGVARAAYFPVFSLDASAGFESRNSQSWIDAPSRLWSLGPSALLTVFDAGRREALSDQARAAYDESVASYRQSVLTAYREVEDNLAALRLLDEELQREEAAVAAAQRALNQAQNRYKGGIVTYLEVVSAQNVALQAQRTEVNLRVQRITAGVLLVKALGGGWNADQLDAPALAAGGAPW
jgi:NodT family efflux transporter outer membrane factor (OMF) lipoprotein